MKTKTKKVLTTIVLFIALIVFAVVILLIGQLIELVREGSLCMALAPVIIIRIDADGVLRQVFSTDPETQVTVYNQEGINLGDEPALSDHDLTELMQKATPNCSAEIKAGKFFEVW